MKLNMTLVLYVSDMSKNCTISSIFQQACTLQIFLQQKKARKIKVQMKAALHKPWKGTKAHQDFSLSFELERNTSIKKILRTLESVLYRTVQAVYKSGFTNLCISE